MKSERISEIEKACEVRGRSGVKSHFSVDYHKAALTTFADLELWEKIARSMAFAMVNQDVYVDKTDGIGGRVYHLNEEPVTRMDPELDYGTEAYNAFKEECPEVEELVKDRLIFTSIQGHITWFFDRVLRLGVTGLTAYVEDLLSNIQDEEAEQFYKGVLIMLDAMQAFNDKHIEAYERIGCHELAERMRKVPRYPAETFEEAVQAFFMQHICVMKENPFGGNGPGRLDYYLWPYLEKDLEAGRCTMEQAKEIVDELFLRINERIYEGDTWGETVVVGGTYPNGSSAVNPLTYIMIDSMIDLDVTHPYFYVRLPENPPKELLKACARYMMSGRNRAQVLNDPAIIDALEKRGILYRDAVEYACGGCMEIGIQGMSSDLLYVGYQNMPKMLELMVTGGLCLRTGKQYEVFKKYGGLVNYSDFESFYRDFTAEVDNLVKLFMHEQDIYSEKIQKGRPSYLLSSLVDDCLARGRNLHAGGVRYHDYGASPVGLPNVADGLYAIKQAVFEKKICTAEELVSAMKDDYVGHEFLQAKLRSIPKYGVDNDDADAMAVRLMSDVSDMYLSFRTRWGGKAKPVILTFIYSPEVGASLGATADGRKTGGYISQGVTPYSASMTEGITAAMKSCCKLQFDKFAGGASTMWDFDSAWANEELIEVLIKSFTDMGGQMFQGNTTPLEDLLEAQKHPEDYKQLIVRVGGYSARFVSLWKELQDEIINRIRHSA